MSTNKKPAKRETYWLPTARSPWAVIYFDQIVSQWRFAGFREKRVEARLFAKFIKTATKKVRVVRAMIPLK